MEESGEDEEEAFFSFLVRENDITALRVGPSVSYILVK